MGFCCGESSDSQPIGQSQGNIYPAGYPTQSQPSPHPALQAYPPRNENGTPKLEMTMRGERNGVSMQSENGFAHGDIPPTTPPAAGDFNPGYPPGPTHTTTAGPGSFNLLLDPNIVRPNPVHARPGTASPPLALDTPEQFTGPGSISSGAPPSMRRNMPGQSNIDDGKLSISVE